MPEAAAVNCSPALCLVGMVWESGDSQLFRDQLVHALDTLGR